MGVNLRLQDTPLVVARKRETAPGRRQTLALQVWSRVPFRPSSLLRTEGAEKRETFIHGAQICAEVSRHYSTLTWSDCVSVFSEASVMVSV